jgi:hypothetical protein
MKPIHLFAATAALAVLSAPVGPAYADPPAAPGQNGSDAQLLAFCETILNSGDYGAALTFGRCMSFNDVSFEGLVTQTCQAFRGEGVLEDYGFDSFDDCVTTLQKEF